MLRHSMLTAFYALVTLSALFSSTSSYARHNYETARADLCNRLLLTSPEQVSVPGSLIDLAAHAIANRPDPALVQPDFFDLRHMRAAANLRKIEPLPSALDHILPSNVGAVMHQLRQAEDPFTIRFAATRGLVPLRAEFFHKGKKVGTNILTGAMTFWERIINPTTKPEFLIGPEKKAAILWIHGGGTPTANANTASDMVDFFDKKPGIATLAVDMPMHGEGPVVGFASDLEVFEYIINLIDSLIAPGVPVFIAGHSMGGQFASMMQRYSNDPRLGPTIHRIKGYVSLSGVADIAPGESLRAKVEKEVHMELSAEERYNRMSPGDRVFLANVVRNAKFAPWTAPFLRVLALHNNWLPPENGGEGLAPLLAIIGKADGLTYVGYEEFFAKYYASFNEEIAKIIIIDERSTIHDVTEPIGHGLFGHYRPGTDKPETYTLVYEFVEDQLKKSGVKLPNLEENPEYKSHVQKFREAIQWLQYWTHNLAFREFAETTTVYRKKLHPELIRKKEIGESIAKFIKGPLQKKVKQLRAKNGGRGDVSDEEAFAAIQSENPEIVPVGIESYNDIVTAEQMVRRNIELTRALFVPEESESIHSVEIRENVNARKEIEGYLSELKNRRADLTKEMTALSERRDEVLTKLQKLLGKASHHDFATSLNRSEALLAQLMDKQRATDRAITEFYLDLAENENLNSETVLDVPEELMQKTLDLKVLLNEYQDALKHAVNLQMELVLNKDLIIENSIEDTQRMHDFAEELWSGSDSITARIEAITAELAPTYQQIADVEKDYYALLERYSELMPNSIFVQRANLSDLFNSKDLATMMESNELLAEAKKMWEALWNPRPPAAKEDLHSTLPQDF